MKQEIRICKKHQVWVKPFYSERLKKYFWNHTFKNVVTDKLETCWVNSEEEEEGFREKQWDYAMDNMIGVERDEEGHIIKE